MLLQKDAWYLLSLFGALGCLCCMPEALDAHGSSSLLLLHGLFSTPMFRIRSAQQEGNGSTSNLTAKDPGKRRYEGIRDGQLRVVRVYFMPGQEMLLHLTVIRRRIVMNISGRRRLGITLIIMPGS